MTDMLGITWPPVKLVDDYLLNISLLCYALRQFAIDQSFDKC
jgi:hypothetical protein